MDERSIDKAPSASLDMMALNKMVVNARSVVRTAKTHLINKLCRNVTDLKQKRGSAQQKEKNLKKAQRFLEEVDSMRTLKDDKVFKYALANVTTFEDVAKSTASPAARAMARIADHRLIQGVVQKFRAEQTDWRDLAAFMLMKQTGRKFKSAKKAEKAKGKKGQQKETEKVNRAENVRASKLMTDVYTQGLFREDEFQKTKKKVETDGEGELNFLQKRRLRLAQEKKEKQQQKLNASQNAGEKKGKLKQKLNSSQSDHSGSISHNNVDSQKLEQNDSNSDSGEEEGSSEGEIDDSDESEEIGEESDDSEEKSLEKSEVSKSKKTDENSKLVVSKLQKSNDCEEDNADSEEDSSDSGEEEEEIETSEDSEGEGESSESEDSVGVRFMPEILRSDEDKLKLTPKKNSVNEMVEDVDSKTNRKKDTVKPLKSKKNSKKDIVEPLDSKKNSKEDTVEPLKSKKNSRKDTVEPLDSKKPSNMNNECVVRHLDIGSVSDKSEEDSEEEEVDDTDDEEKTTQSKITKKGKAVPKFLTEKAPKLKKMPKDSFFEGGDCDSDSENSEKEGSDDDEDDTSKEILGHKGKIKSMIYDQGGRGAGRGRGRGRGGGSRGGGGRGGKQGKKQFGRGGGGDDGFSFGNKEVMYKQRNQSIITGEGKTKLVTEKKEEPKSKLHPSWEASRKRKAEQSGGIKAFAGKKICFEDD